ncbi:unnamed protein product, partial [Prorocentrum cordatum]
TLNGSLECTPLAAPIPRAPVARAANMAQAGGLLAVPSAMRSLHALPCRLFGIVWCSCCAALLHGSPRLGLSDAARTVVLVLFDSKRLDQWPGFLAYYANSGTPIGALDVVCMDRGSKEMMDNFTRERPGFVRKVQIAYGPNSESTRVKAGSPRRLWPPDNYQRDIFVFIEQRLKAGEHVIHLDLDAYPIQDVWRFFVLGAPSSVGEPRASADVIAGCDCFGPGRLEHLCALNPGVSFYRASAGTLKLVQGVLDIWDSCADQKKIMDCVGAPGRQGGDSGMIQGRWKSSQEGSDMFMLNKQIIQGSGEMHLGAPEEQKR